MATLPRCQHDNHVLTIAVVSDDGRQVLDSLSYAAIEKALRAAAADDGARVIVLRGLTGCFCLGGDLSEFIDPGKHRSLIAAVTALFQTLATFPKPIIALVDGAAVGVGCTILFHCDLVVASHSSTFRVPFVDFGLVPDAATSILAPERMGYAGAFRFFCLGEELDAQAARSMGLVAEIADPADIDARVKAIAHKLTRKPVRALQQTRALLRGDARTLCERVDREIGLFQEALADEATIRRLKRITRRAA